MKYFSVLLLLLACSQKIKAQQIRSCTCHFLLDNPSSLIGKTIKVGFTYDSYNNDGLDLHYGAVTKNQEILNSASSGETKDNEIYYTRSASCNLDGRFTLRIPYTIQNVPRTKLTSIIVVGVLKDERTIIVKSIKREFE